MLVRYLEHPDLPHGDLLDGGVVVGLEELLDGDGAARLLLAALEHHAVAPLPHHALVLVLVHPNAPISGPPPPPA